jgi:hypothetical protein
VIHVSFFFVSRPIIPPGDSHHPSESPKVLPTLPWIILDKFCILLRFTDLNLVAKKRWLDALSISKPSDNEVDARSTEVQLSTLLATCSMGDFTFRHIPTNYYDQPLEEARRTTTSSRVTPSPSSVRSSSWYGSSSSLSVRFVEHFGCVTALGWLLLHSYDVFVEQFICACC